MKVIHGPDHNGALVPVLWSKVEDRDSLSKWSWFFQMANAIEDEMSWLEYHDIFHDMLEAWDNQDKFDELWAELPIDLAVLVNDAITRAWVAGETVNRLNPDLIIACHGYNDQRLWFATTSKGDIEMNIILKEAYKRGYRTVWIISCNPEGIAPIPPSGMKVWWRTGKSNPLYGDIDLWECEE